MLVHLWLLQPERSHCIMTGEIAWVLRCLPCTTQTLAGSSTLTTYGPPSPPRSKTLIPNHDQNGGWVIWYPQLTLQRSVNPLLTCFCSKDRWETTRHVIYPHASASRQWPCLYPEFSWHAPWPGHTNLTDYSMPKDCYLLPATVPLSLHIFQFSDLLNTSDISKRIGLLCKAKGNVD